jgi:hypothetical protein
MSVKDRGKNSLVILATFGVLIFATVMYFANSQEGDPTKYDAMEAEALFSEEVNPKEFSLDPVIVDDYIAAKQEILRARELEDNKLYESGKNDYNQKVLSILESLPDEKKEEACKYNSKFIPSDETEAKIIRICSNFKPKHIPEVKGVNSKQADYSLFVIPEDLLK